MNEERRIHWDLQAPYYSSGEGQHRYRQFLALYEASCWQYIEPCLPLVENAKILEVGCGVGRWVYRLAPMGFQMTMSDLSPAMIKNAREKIEDLGLDNRIDGYHVLDICDLSSLTDCSFDLVLALGGPLGLCEDIMMGVSELYRVTKFRGYVICDVANRYRTALDLVRDGEPDQILEVLSTGNYSRSDGLTDYRFTPEELCDVFSERGWELITIAGICPFFDFLPNKESVEDLDNDWFYKAMLEVSSRHAEEPPIVGLSGRLLIVARRSE